MALDEDDKRWIANQLEGFEARLLNGLANADSRVITKMAEWSERIDVSLADVLRRLSALEERVRKLEGGR